MSCLNVWLILISILYHSYVIGTKFQEYKVWWNCQVVLYRLKSLWKYYLYHFIRKNYKRPDLFSINCLNVWLILTIFISLVRKWNNISRVHHSLMKLSGCSFSAQQIINYTKRLYKTGFIFNILFERMININ